MLAANEGHYGMVEALVELDANILIESKVSIFLSSILWTLFDIDVVSTKRELGLINSV